jgi:CheY-like chemotaxis protein
MFRNPPRVLIIEDDDVIRTMLLAAFRKESVHVDGARDGLDGLNCLRAAPYAVVLLDLMMPRMSGFELLDTIAEDGGLPRPVLFVMTAYDDAALHRLDSSIVHGVIRKPFDLERLVEVVRDCAHLYEELRPSPMRHFPPDIGDSSCPETVC